MSQIRVPTAWWVGRALEDKSTRVFAVTAGLGAGKTHGIAQWHHLMVRENKGAPFSGFLEPDYRKISDAAIPTYCKVLEQFGMEEGRHYEIVKSPFPKLVYLDQKHEVHFLSAETPKKIVAVEYSHASEDESGIVSAEASENLRSRIRDNRAKRRQFMRGGAPQGINAFANVFDSRTLPGWSFPHWRDHMHLERRWRRFILWTDDNKHLPADYIDTLVDTYGHNPNLLKSYRYGEFCELAEGSAYSNYNPVIHDCEPRTADPHREITCTLDFNYSPLAWVALQCVPFDEYERRRFRYVILNEANEGHETLEDAAVEFASKFNPAVYGNTTIALYGDRSGWSKSHKIAGSDFENFARYLRELGFKRVEIRATKEVAPEASSVEAVQRLFGNNHLLVAKNCRMTRKSFMATRWKDGVRKIDKPSGETWTHHGDAVKYFAWQELREFNGNHTNQVYGASF